MNPFSHIATWYSYDAFMAFTEALVAAGKTSGPDQSPEMVDYTKMNLQRMQRWNKTFTAPEGLIGVAQAAEPQIWWVITEPWCGDNAANLPQIARIAQAAPDKIELRIILRDEHPEVMDQYLTNGSRSIPLLISRAKNDGRQLFVWGPRPAALQDFVLEWKARPGEKSFDELKTEVQQWYNRDKGAHLTGELSGKLAPLHQAI